MAKYEICIRKIETKMVKHKTLYSDHPKEVKEEDGFYHWETEETVEEPIYTQRTDKDIDIKKVIDSFNQ